MKAMALVAILLSALVPGLLLAGSGVELPKETPLPVLVEDVN